MLRSGISVIALACLLAAPGAAQDKGAPAAPPPAVKAPTAAEADAFVADAEKVLAAKSVDAQRIAWVNE